MTRDEARAAGLKRYQGVPCKHGHLGERYVSTKQCVDCLRTVHNYANVNPVRDKEVRKARQQCGDKAAAAARYAEYYANNRELVLERQRERHKLDPQKYVDRVLKWAKANPGARKAIMARVRVKRKKGEFPLSEQDVEWMREIYEQCPPGYEVDHIYPINGTNSCGLHVPWNLQYLTKKENRRKTNKLPEEFEAKLFEHAA